MNVMKANNATTNGMYGSERLPRFEDAVLAENKFQKRLSSMMNDLDDARRFKQNKRKEKSK